MIKKLSTKSFFLFFASIFSHTYGMDNSWYTDITQFAHNNGTLIVAGVAAACIIGKAAYNRYYSQSPSYEQCIDNCRTTYKNMLQEIDHYHKLCYSDAQMSDWELKEIIMNNNKETYPFINYYAQLVKNAWALKKCLNTIAKTIQQINESARHLTLYGKTEHTIHLEEKFVQLAAQGKNLQEYALRTLSLVSILHKRIKLFREYSDDCYNWSQGKKIKQEATIL
jgi:hypothetical protein